MRLDGHSFVASVGEQDEIGFPFDSYDKKMVRTLMDGGMRERIDALG
jgi:hypothetical protein